MKIEKLKNKYSKKELSDSFVFRNKLSLKEKGEATKQLNEARKELRRGISEKEKTIADLLQLKFVMEDYINNPSYRSTKSFAYFLNQYTELLGISNRVLAHELGVNETLTSRILGQTRKPTESLIVRLETHSNKTIPAITWYKVLEKENEFAFLSNRKFVQEESKHVRKRLAI
ncbi:MAG: hypothetical protein J0M08_06705 [Bacteroidetes bacterium]|nr:hypothetical protein [Bacteroidota bacterium]